MELSNYPLQPTQRKPWLASRFEPFNLIQPRKLINLIAMAGKMYTSETVLRKELHYQEDREEGAPA